MLCISKNGDKDNKKRDVLSTLSGIAWNRVCPDCNTLILNDNKRKSELTKCTLISCVSPGFVQFCIFQCLYY